MCRSVEHYIAHYLASPNQKLSVLETTVTAALPVEKNPVQIQKSSFDRLCRNIQEQLRDAFFDEGHFVREFTKKVLEAGHWEPIPETVSLDTFWNPKVASPNKRQSKLFASYVQTIKTAEGELSVTGMFLIDALQSRVLLYQRMAAQPRDQWTSLRIAGEPKGFPVSDGMAKSQLTEQENMCLSLIFKEETIPATPQAPLSPNASLPARKQIRVARVEEPQVKEATTPTPPRPAPALPIASGEPSIVAYRAHRVVRVANRIDTYFKWVKKSDGSESVARLIHNGRDDHHYFSDYNYNGNFITANKHAFCVNVEDLQDFVALLDASGNFRSSRVSMTNLPVPRAFMSNDTNYKFENGSIFSKKHFENTPDGVVRIFENYSHHINDNRVSATKLTVQHPNGGCDIYRNYSNLPS